MDKERIGFLAFVAIVIIAVVCVLFSVLTVRLSEPKPEIVFISFESGQSTYWGLLTVQNVGGAGEVKITADRDVVYNGYVEAGRVLKLQTDWWAIIEITVEYDDGSHERFYVD